MSADHNSISAIGHEVMRHWGATLLDVLGGQSNKHWLVEAGGSRLVLRAYPLEPMGDIDYELAVLRRLRGLGWPVPAAVEGPMHLEGQTWCLFTWLPGVSKPAGNTAGEQRIRGRLLAELHHDTARLAWMGQRKGFGFSNAVVCDPALVSSIRAYERLYPAEGHVMRWHLDHAQEAFARIAGEAVEPIVLHSDFTCWNLLFEGECLTGILDFEATHLNYRVADFALSWRGMHDEVIHGYEEVHKLTDLDWELLIPTYWSWLFIGVEKEIAAMLSGGIPPHGFTWQVAHLMRRSGMLSQRTLPYPGYTGGS